MQTEDKGNLAQKLETFKLDEYYIHDIIQSHAYIIYIIRSIMMVSIQCSKLAHSLHVKMHEYIEYVEIN